LRNSRDIVEQRQGFIAREEINSVLSKKKLESGEVK
jgi:hypothetical protein